MVVAISDYGEKTTALRPDSHVPLPETSNTLLCPSGRLSTILQRAIWFTPVRSPTHRRHPFPSGAVQCTCVHSPSVVTTPSGKDDVSIWSVGESPLQSIKGASLQAQTHAATEIASAFRRKEESAIPWIVRRRHLPRDADTGSMSLRCRTEHEHAGVGTSVERPARLQDGRSLGPRQTIRRAAAFWSHRQACCARACGALAPPPEGGKAIGHAFSSATRQDSVA